MGPQPEVNPEMGSTWLEKAIKVEGCQLRRMEALFFFFFKTTSIHIV